MREENFLKEVFPRTPFQELLNGKKLRFLRGYSMVFLAENEVFG